MNVLFVEISSPYFVKFLLTNYSFGGIIHQLTSAQVSIENKIRTSYDWRGGARIPMTAPRQGDYGGGVKLLEV